MKNNKNILKVSFITAAIVALYLLIFGHEIYVEKTPEVIDQKHYATPEAAIESELLTDNYVLVESNGTYFAVCDTNVNDYACQYIFNDGNGWQIVTDYMFRNAFYVKEDRKGLFQIYIRQYKGKYMIYVSQDINSIEENGLLTIADNKGSSFSEMNFDFFIEEHYWYWCVDEMPEDYEITINGKVVYS